MLLKVKQYKLFLPNSFKGQFVNSHSHQKSIPSHSMQELLWVSVGSSFFDGLDLGVKLARDLTGVLDPQFR